MVVHVAQTLGARIEVRRLMRLELMLCTPQSSSPLITPIQDTILGLYLMSHPDIFMREDQYRRYLAQAVYLPVEDIGLSMPAMISRVESDRGYTAWRSGRQLFSGLCPTTSHYTKDTTYFHCYPKIKTKTGLTVTPDVEIDDWFDAEKPEMLILDGELLRGILTKSMVGTSSSGFLYQLILEFGFQCALRFITDIQRVVNHWLMDYGFSVGPSDCVLPNEKKYVEMLHNGLDAIRKFPLLKIHSFGIDENEAIKPQTEEEEEEETIMDGVGEALVAAGETSSSKKIDEKAEEEDVSDEEAESEEEEEVESSMKVEPTNVSSIARRHQKSMTVANREEQATLSRKREQATLRLLHKLMQYVGTQVMKELKYWNRLVQLTVCGAKGSEDNMRQIFAGIGQQEIQGGRIPADTGRITSHFPKPGTIISHEFAKWVLSDRLLAQGFIPTSYTRRGMNVLEYYNHLRSSRQNVSTSILATGTTGYQQRRLVQGATNLVVKDDLSVRDAAGNLLQILYGKDGMDATLLPRFDLALLKMNNAQLVEEYNSLPYLNDILWPLEKQLPMEADPFRSVEELGRLLIAELALIRNYRDIIRHHRLHYDPTQMDVAVSVPANIRLILHSAQTKQWTRRTSSVPKEVMVLSPSVLVRLVHSSFERLYSFYPGFFNRLWVFEALILSELSIKNVLVNYALDYISMEFVLAEIERQFAQKLADPHMASGILASQLTGQLGTQKTLDAHRGGIQELEEGAGTSMFQEIVNISESPSNPVMTVHPISNDRLRKMFDERFISSVICKGNSSEAMPENELRKHMAQFICDQLVQRKIQDLTCAAPRVLCEPNILDTIVHEDQDWLQTQMDLWSDDEKVHMVDTRSNIVLRFVLDAGKCSHLQMGPRQVVDQIHKFLKEIKPGPLVPYDDWYNKDRVESDLNDGSIFGTDTDTDLFALISPTMSFSELSADTEGADTSEEEHFYWVLRLYVSKKSKYYVQGMQSKSVKGNELKLVKGLMQELNMNALISGVPGISAAIVKEEISRTVDEKTGEIVPTSDHVVITRGSNLEMVLGYPLVDDVKTHSTHLPESCQVWGIEAAANCINRALGKSLMAHGDFINDRHLEQIVKTICHRGNLMALNRFGINKQQDRSVFQKASFEQQVECISDACAAGVFDPLQGITENCMLGKEVPVGTGAVRMSLAKGLVPSAEVMKSHQNFIESRVLPVLNELDYRIMLDNSGEEQLNRVTIDADENLTLHLQETARIMHHTTSEAVRLTSLDVQKDLIASTEFALRGSDNALILDTTRTDSSKDADDETKEEEMDFFTRLQLKQAQTQEWLRKRVAAQKAFGDHAMALALGESKMTAAAAVRKRKQGSGTMDIEDELRHMKRSFFAVPIATLSMPVTTTALNSLIVPDKLTFKF